MTSAVHKWFANALAPLFRCVECDGRGKVEYGNVPQAMPDYRKADAIYDNPEPSKTLETCRACKGTGRS